MMMIGVVERESRPLPHNIHPSTHPSIFHPWFSCPKTNDADDADDLGEMPVDKIGTYHITLIHPSIYHPSCSPKDKVMMMMMMMI
jgi:hypothetical protein